MGDPVDWGHILTDVLPNTGAMGALALFLFHIYRQDQKKNAERMAELVLRQERQTEGWVKIVQDNTVQLERMNQIVSTAGRRG